MEMGTFTSIFRSEGAGIFGRGCGGLTVGLILGGALGNLIDRLRLHYVVDFIDVHWGRYHWPSFNVADTAITVGAISLFIVMAKQGEVEKDSPMMTEAPPEECDNLSANETSVKKTAAEDMAPLN